jgi:hypothetical protein
VDTVIASSWSWVHDDEGQSQALLDVDQLELRLLAQLPVERAKWLVEQQYLRPLDHSARQRHPLLLPARKLMRLSLGELAQLHQVQHLFDAARDFRSRHVLLLQAERDVLLDRHVRKQGVRLKHHIDRAAVRRHLRHIDTVDLDRAGGRILEPRQHPQQRRLAAPGRPEQREELAAVDVEPHVIDRDEIVELLDNVPDLDERDCVGVLPGFGRQTDEAGFGLA